ncbi:MAG TPA: NUDIX domain-containing protein [Thermomicrobiales bacterium]|nr:NUDIX domain-containing protein [Thermomicrobiales bacterium]
MFLVLINVEAAVYRDGRYLMIVRGDEEDHAAGMLAFPGGKLDYAEQPDILELTAAREVLEETGVEVDQFEYVEAHSFTTPDGTPVVDIVFLCRYVTGTPTITDPGEVAALRWMTAEETLGDDACPPWMRTSLALVERKRQALGW